MGCGASSSAALPVEPKTEKIDKRPPSPPPDLELPPADLDSVKESSDINDASGSESEDDEPLVVWPEGKNPIVDGRLYGKQFAPPPPKPGIPIKAVLSSRASYGSGDVLDNDSKMGPVMAFCPFCMRLGLMMREAGLEYDTYLIDSRDKPSWFVDNWAEATTPALLGTPGGVSNTKWSGGFDTTVACLKEQSPQFVEWLERKPVNEKHTIEYVGGLGSKFGFTSMSALIADTSMEAGLGLVKGMCSGAGLTEWPEDESPKDRKQRLVKFVQVVLAELDEVVKSLDGKFVGGDAPCEADCHLLTSLYFANSYVNVGFGALPQMPCTLAQAGAPNCLPYIQRWIKRESFQYSYKHTNETSAAAVMALAPMFIGKATDVTDDDEVFAQIMQRARDLDPVYDGIDKAK